MTNGTIFAIKHFAVHDGPGIRTTVFMKGCPLSCLWCHNPEGIGFSKQTAYYAHKCISCGECMEVCAEGAHTIGTEGHIFDRSKCVACGKCAEVCLGGALEFFGKTVTPEEILPELLEDRDFYISSGGGVTFSGGECLMQADFCRETSLLLKKENIDIAIDTCGFVAPEAIDKVIDVADIFLYDIKADGEDIHKSCTGQPNTLIWKNLEYITSRGKRCEIRIPFIPQYNSVCIEGIAEKLSRFQNITAVRVLPYHNFSSSKYDSLGKPNTMPDVPPPTHEQLAVAVTLLKSYGLNAICDFPQDKEK